MDDKSFFNSVSDFIAWSGGDHAIEKILVANNGIGATKAIRSIRRWAFDTFGNERAIKFVVMATPEDMNANAEYIRMADQVVDVPGGSNNNNYANINLICEIAQRLKVDAVIPMWGHASENPALPTSLKKLKHRVTFIGPAAEPMQALGDKIGSTIIAQSAGVPTIGWNGDGLTVDYQKTGIPDAVYDEANVKTAEDALECAIRIGFPVMIKASEGGGGKGIRKALRAEDVTTLYRQVQAEIPGSPIFVMKMASRARHLEVQLLADKYGDAIALSGRDCSVQRRHQKIVEEGPPIIAPPNVFKKMERAAVALAKTVGYCNAGTVEYLFMEETQEFAFLELNPRLQVEHPVTENILGINLPACQLQVAMGIPLHRIMDIRKLYGRHPRGKDTIDFDYTERAAPPRHCIAIRITAENPDAGFQPASGKIRELQFRSSIDVWGYFSVDNSGQIHEYADSQFGHLFAGGKDRESARKAMIVALKELQIRGDIRTTTEYIIKMLQSEDFVNNSFNTDWLDGRLARHQELSAIENKKFCPPPTVVATCGSALQGFKHFHQRDTEFIGMLKVGQVPNKDTLSPQVKIDLIFNNVKYKTTCLQNGPEKLVITCNQINQNVKIRPLADGGYLLNVQGVNHLVYAQEESGGSLRMVMDGHTCIFTPEYDPTKFVSSVAGKIARLLVADGAHVVAGEPFVEIEVMKMYMPLKAVESGTVHFQKSEGATLTPGDLIAKIQLDNPDLVVHAEEFKGSLIESIELDEEAKIEADLPHIKLREHLNDIEKVLEGFPLIETDIDTALQGFINSKKHPLLPAYKVEECLAVLRGRIDQNLTNTILELNGTYKESISNGFSPKYPAASILLEITSFANSLPADKKTAFINQINDLWINVEPFLFSLEDNVFSSLVIFLDNYLNVEKLFDDMSFTDVVNQLRKDFSSNLDTVLKLCRAHANIKTKNVLVSKIIDYIETMPIVSSIKRPELPSGIILRNELQTRKLKSKLTDLAKLKQGVYSHIAFSANLLLMDQFNPSVESRRQRLNDTIVAALTAGDDIGQGDRAEELEKFVDSNIVIRDLLIDALRSDSDYKLAVIELYIRKVYQKSHNLVGMNGGGSLNPDGSDKNAWIGYEFITRSLEGFGDDHSSPLVHKNVSFSDLVHLQKATSLSEMAKSPIKSGTPSYECRHGIAASIDSIDDLPQYFPFVVSKLSEEVQSEPLNAIHIIISTPPSGSEDDISNKLSYFLVTQEDIMVSKFVRRVTFFVGKPDASASKPSVPSIFTFRQRSRFAEDRLFRHVEAPHAFHLDLLRLKNFDIQLEEGIQISSGNVLLYKAQPKSGVGLSRYFARIVSFTADTQSSDFETLFVEALDQLSLALAKDEALGRRKGQKHYSHPPSNHFFLNVVSPNSVVMPDQFEALLRKICNKYWYKMFKFAVTTVELKLIARVSLDADPLFMCFVASNPTGYVLKIDKYIEVKNGDRKIFRGICKHGHKASWDGLDTEHPYDTEQKFEIQRAEALTTSDTLYVYDWPLLFESAVEKLWLHEGHSTPEKSFVCHELVLCDKSSREPLPRGWSANEGEANGLLLPIDREPGLNDVGMVAWHIKISTPEYPTGRELVVICNDITFQAGSFGTKEDVLFFKASEYARLRGIPRIFLTANSGARIGMAQSLKTKFNICFNDENDPSKGFKYIYLTQSDYENLMTKYNGNVKDLPVICSELEVGTEKRYVISDIIGEEPDLGVENLMGSGLIAGETARAYNDIFTLTMVVGRTVGIGAYLVRLGQRTIQKTRNAPIILTGYQALNKLMGREIYTTNDQLGGPMIMYPNGVSHLLAETHFDAVVKGLEWLSFIPSMKGAAIPVKQIDIYHDPVDRLVQYAPQKGVTYDPRLLLSGLKLTKDESSWKSGFFDKNSFVETLGGWAKTVIVGRGRLGGIPIGVIVTENRTAEATKPADPADVTSQEKLIQQAGGVWFPDSAYKTAQALRDFNREGLPCIVFANWRGFSGGQRDMFDEILKFGSMIVDALVAYQQPLLVYIPPFSELRGGAWVVVDSTINADVMEFYAAEDARGGVLEAAGAASIKFRDRDIILCAHRLDHGLIQLDRKLKEAEAAGQNTEEINKQIKQRERLLFGVYSQVAVHFADLHDTPGRMLAKGVIRRLVPWAESRSFFYWRLKRRLKEFELYNSTVVDKSISRKQFTDELLGWFLGLGNTIEQYEDDKFILQWFQTHSTQLEEFLWSKKSTVQAQQLSSSLSSLLSGPTPTTAQLEAAFSSLTPEQRALLKASL